MLFISLLCLWLIYFSGLPGADYIKLSLCGGIIIFLSTYNCNIRTQIHQKKWLPELHQRLISYKARDVIIPITLKSFEEEVYRSRLHGTAMFKDTRNQAVAEPYRILTEIVKEHNMTHFLVYSNIVEHHESLKEFLEKETKLTVDIMSGNTKDKTATQAAFNRGDIDVLVFSTISGRDLPAEAVIFWEWDVYAAQSLGRAVRSKIVQKNFTVWFLVNTLYETDMFMNTVVKTGLLNEKALGKNIFKQLN